MCASAALEESCGTNSIPQIDMCKLILSSCYQMLGSTLISLYLPTQILGSLVKEN